MNVRMEAENRERFEDVMLLASKMKEGVRSQGMKEAEGKETDS